MGSPATTRSLMLTVRTPKAALSSRRRGNREDEERREMPIPRPSVTRPARVSSSGECRYQSSRRCSVERRDDCQDGSPLRPHYSGRAAQSGRELIDKVSSGDRSGQTRQFSRKTSASSTRISMLVVVRPFEGHIGERFGRNPLRVGNSNRDNSHSPRFLPLASCCVGVASPSIPSWCARHTIVIACSTPS